MEPWVSDARRLRQRARVKTIDPAVVVALVFRRTKNDSGQSVSINHKCTEMDKHVSQLSRSSIFACWITPRLSISLCVSLSFCRCRSLVGVVAAFVPQASERNSLMGQASTRGKIYTPSVSEKALC